MKKYMWFAIVTASIALLVACGDEESATCNTGDKKCGGEQILTCTDGVWGNPESCPSGQSCHDMAGDSVDHCMAMGMD